MPHFIAFVDRESAEAAGLNLAHMTSPRQLWGARLPEHAYHIIGAAPRPVGIGVRAGESLLSGPAPYEPLSEYKEAFDRLSRDPRYIRLDLAGGN